MLITKEIVEDMAFQYGYENGELVIISETEKGDIIMSFRTDSDSCMDVIYSISGIVQDILDKVYGNGNEYYDYPWVRFAETGVTVTFSKETFDYLEK